MFVVPTSVRVAIAVPLKLKSAVVYSALLIPVTLYPVTVCGLPSYTTVPVLPVIVTTVSAAVGSICSQPSSTTTLMLL